MLAKSGNTRAVEEALDRADVLRNRINRLVRSVRVGRTIRLKRQFDGHDLDLDAMLDAGIALRMGQDTGSACLPLNDLEASRPRGASYSSTFRNRRATGWPPVHRSSMSSASRLRF